jgi:hypothetical protein
MTYYSCIVLALGILVMPFGIGLLVGFKWLRYYLIGIYKVLIDIIKGNWERRRLACYFVV